MYFNTAMKNWNVEAHILQSRVAHASRGSALQVQKILPNNSFPVPKTHVILGLHCILIKSVKRFHLKQNGFLNFEDRDFPDNHKIAINSLNMYKKLF